jgi:hypothetical protein
MDTESETLKGGGGDEMSQRVKWFVTPQRNAGFCGAWARIARVVTLLVEPMRGRECE